MPNNYTLILWGVLKQVRRMHPDDKIDRPLVYHTLVGATIYGGAGSNMCVC